MARDRRLSLIRPPSSSPTQPAEPGPADDADLDPAALGLAHAVRVGLSRMPKELPCRFFYDERGSALFEEICALPEYYLTRAEEAILAHRAAEILDRIPAPRALVELGSGSATKTRRVIDAALARQHDLLYVPIDISRSALELSADALLEDYPQLEILALEGEYEACLQTLDRRVPTPRLALWLGSSVGNFGREDAARFLSRVHDPLGPDGHLLLGVDRRKDPAVLERAYDDARGTTARFNLNLLERINSELGGEFESGRFRHRAIWREDEGRVEMHLESAGEQVVRIEKLDLDVRFAPGETIHTESSYKYSDAEVEALAEAAGFAVLDRWLDPDERFCLAMLASA